MQASIPVHSIRVLTRILTFLSRVGDTISFLAASDYLRISSTNAARSAYASIELKSSFFEKYSTIANDVKFQVLAKSLLWIFRSKGFDKNLESCDLRLHDSKNSSRLIIRLHLKYGVLKIYRLVFETDSGLRALYDKSLLPYSWRIGPTTLKEWVEHFHIRLEEVTFFLGTDWALIRSHSDEMTGTTDALKRPITTELTLDVEEFENYFIENDVHITFSLKEFKALILIAEGIGLGIEANFEQGGKPIIFIIQSESFTIELVIATISDEGISIRRPNPNTLRTTQVIPRNTKNIVKSSRLKKVSSKINFDARTLARQSGAAQSASRNAMGGEGFDNRLPEMNQIINGGNNISRLAGNISKLGNFNKDRNDIQTPMEIDTNEITSEVIHNVIQDPDISSLIQDDNNDENHSTDQDVTGTPPTKKIKTLFDV